MLTNRWRKVVDNGLLPEGAYEEHRRVIVEENVAERLRGNAEVGGREGVRAGV